MHPAGLCQGQAHGFCSVSLWLSGEKLSEKINVRGSIFVNTRNRVQRLQKANQGMISPEDPHKIFSAAVQQGNMETINHYQTLPGGNWQLPNGPDQEYFYAAEDF